MFRWLLDTALANRLLVLLTAAVLMAQGAYTLSRTQVDVFPDLNQPTVTLMTEAGGMAPEEVEQLITFPLETALNGLPGVQAVRSTSSAGLSFVYVTFVWSTDLYRARQGRRPGVWGPPRAGPGPPGWGGGGGVPGCARGRSAWPRSASRSISSA